VIIILCAVTSATITKKTVTVCPVCKGTDLVFKSSGTKAIVDEVEKIFPALEFNALIQIIKKAERFEAHYENITVVI